MVSSEVKGARTRSSQLAQSPAGETHEERQRSKRKRKDRDLLYHSVSASATRGS